MNNSSLKENVHKLTRTLYETSRKSNLSHVNGRNQTDFRFINRFKTYSNYMECLQSFYLCHIRQ